MELFIKSYGSYKPGNQNERARCPGQGRSSCPGLRCISTCLSLTMAWVLLLWNRHLSYGRIGWQWNSRPLKGQEATDRSRGSPGTLSGGITRKEADIVMGTIIWKNVIMLIAVTVFGIILILLGIRKKKSVYFAAFFFPGLLLLMCSVLFVFAEPYQIRKTMRTDCHILKLDTQYIVSIDGKDMEDIPVKEDASREDYALEITENFNLAGMLLKTEYLLYVPVTTMVIQ